MLKQFWGCKVFNLQENISYFKICAYILRNGTTARTVVTSLGKDKLKYIIFHCLQRKIFLYDSLYYAFIFICLLDFKSSFSVVKPPEV